MTGTCPACHQEVALMAVNCPHCGHGPLAGHYIRGMDLSPADRAKREADMAQGLVRLMFASVAVIAGLGVIWMVCVAVLGASEAVSQIPFGSIFGAIGHALAVFLKWVAIAALIFLPFAVMGGFLAKSSGNEFGQGYWWGQILGPVGLIVVVFQPSEERHGQPRRKKRENSGYVFDESSKVETTECILLEEEAEVIPYICSSCGKKYKLSPKASGTTFSCIKCKAINMVPVSLKENSNSHGGLSDRPT